MNKRLHPPLPNKGHLRITKNFRGITLTSIAAKVYIYIYLTDSDNPSNHQKSSYKKS